MLIKTRKIQKVFIKIFVKRRMTRMEVFIMNLKKILIGIEGVKAKGNLDLEIASIECDYRSVKEGSLFVAIKGFEVDGHSFIGKAIEKGATAIAFEEGADYREFIHYPDVTFLMVPNTRLALSQFSCNFFDHPSKKMKVIGITGTKGKSTTSFMLKKLLEKHGKKVGLIGTIAVYIGDKKVKNSDRTTPESNKLQEILDTMYRLGIEVVIMEVSSQSLKLDRVTGMEFYAGIFTNFSEDHISKTEHKDMEDYFESKMKLFDMCQYAFINADNLYTAKAARLIEGNCKVATYGIDNYCNLLAKDVTITNTYADFKVKLDNKNERIKVSIPGRFSVYNALAAISVAKLFGIKTEEIKEALENVKVLGRSELVENKLDLKIMIDYAHTPDSLENILKTVKQYTIGKVICVFGCGGDRDQTKRPIMGEIAGRVADYTIITSDNPRTEEPEEIIKEIEAGIKKTKGNYECIVNRREAIQKAISMEHKNDILIIAGKGHEMYQEIKKEKLPFDERVIVQEIIEEIEHSSKKKK